MIKFENTEVFGWEAAIRGMRNPMNSWDKSDSCYLAETIREGKQPNIVYSIGKNDMDLMKRLRKAGTDHRKYLRMITVSVDITAPRYWWLEYDTYKVGTVANSCSTMHKIHAKEFTLYDFSFNRLDYDSIGMLSDVIEHLNYNRKKYLETKDKKYWWQMIQLLPQSYNQKRTIMLNYEVLNNMYRSRKNHKLDEWTTGFCEWVKTLPYAEELIIE